MRMNLTHKATEGKVQRGPAYPEVDELRRTTGMLSCLEQAAYALNRARQLADYQRRRTPVYAFVAPIDATAWAAMLRKAA